MPVELTEEWARTAPAGPELDLICHRWLGKEPTRVPCVTSDGGKSSCAWVSRDGPWINERQLREWLEERHEAGTHQNYEMGAWLECPRYSEDWAASGPLLGELTRISADGQILRTVTMCKTADTRDETLRLSLSVMSEGGFMGIEDVMVWADDLRHAAARVVAVLAARGIPREEATDG